MTLMNRYLASLIWLVAATACVAAAPAPETTPTSHRGVYAVNGRLHVSLFGTPDGEPITTGPDDMKPSWAKTGDWIVFFRRTKSAPRVSDWKTAICVVKANGTGFRKLTDGTQTDFNPTWTRDGQNKVVFSRLDPANGKYVIYMTTPGANPGDEVPVSDLRYGSFAYTCLKDGRILTSGTGHPAKAGNYLMTPGKAANAIYEPVKFTFQRKGFLDRLSLTPSETKVTYEFQHGTGPYTYPGRTIYIADFDANTRTLSNPVAITNPKPDPKVTVLYPRWTRDESAVVYHCDKTGKPQLYLYRLTDGSTIRVSTNPDARYLFPCGEATPK